jgi:hypothetical protein
MYIQPFLLDDDGFSVIILTDSIHKNQKNPKTGPMFYSNQTIKL